MKTTVKLTKQRALTIIQEEIDAFIKHKKFEESNGKLLDEFSSVFSEALENPNIKSIIRSQLAFILENIETIQPETESNEVQQLKTEIMFYLGGLNIQQLEHILQIAGSMRKQVPTKPAPQSGPIANPFQSRG